MTHTELLAWAAGFVDGEGTINLYRRTDRNREFRVSMSVVNTRKDSLERLQALFGGSIQNLHKDTPNRNWKPSFIWFVSHQKARAAIAQLLPYLFIKLPQAQLALEAQTCFGRAGHSSSEETVERLSTFLIEFRRLNKKGRVSISAT